MKIRVSQVSAHDTALAVTAEGHHDILGFVGRRLGR
ncbi:hypothetical protein [Streptomyces sp. NPDC088748]